jgi:uncharacterized alpha-E superfamily protein
VLLSRVADSLYWAARSLERAACTSRIVWGYTEGIVDLPVSAGVAWEPLLAITGSRDGFMAHYGTERSERAIVSYLLADVDHAGSVRSCVDQARENLRSCRDVVPQFAWTVVNDLYLYVESHEREGVARRSRSRFVERVRRDLERVDGIIEATMIRDEAHDLWMLGQLLERADMTTRVLGVQAAGLLDTARPQAHVQVQWMTVLRSVSGRQMYQRATRQPINGPAVVDFLVSHPGFPRSVRFCVDRMAIYLAQLPRTDEVRDALAAVEAAAAGPADPEDAYALDAAMDRIQLALAGLSSRITATYGWWPA